MWQCPVSYSQAEFCEAVRNLYPRLGSVVGFTVWILTENRKILERIPDQVGIGNTSPVRIYLVYKDKTRLASLHGHIGSNQMNQNVEPKTFFQKGKSHYLAEIRECGVYRRKNWGNLIQQPLFERSATNI